MISIKLNCSRIAKDHLYAGKNGKYLNLLLMTNKDGPDQYGNDGFVCQSVSAEAKAAGIRGPIIGNWKCLDVGKNATGATQVKPAAKPQKAPDPLNGPVNDDSDSVPF